MKRSLLIIGLSVLLSCTLVFSCAKVVEAELGVQEEELTGTGLTNRFTFSAYLDSESRTHLGEEGAVLWNASDKVRVFNADTPEGVEYSLIDGGGTTRGTFSGEPLTGEGPYYVVYPSEAAVILSGTALSVSIPSSQEYAADSFGPGSNLAAGTGAQLDGIHFMNLSGSVAVTLTGDRTITGIRLCGYDVAPLYGSAVIDGWEGAVPALTMETGQTGESFREVFLDCGTGVSLTDAGKVFYLAVPRGTLGGGYRIEVYDTDGLAMVKYAKADEANRVERSTIVRMPSLAYVPGYKAAFLRSEAVGAFQNAAADGAIAAACTYVEGRGQYSFLNTSETRYLRLQDWTDGYALAFTTPYTLTQGKTAGVTVTSLGLASIASAQVDKMRVVKMQGDRVWMLDPDTKNGYILMMVED